MRAHSLSTAAGATRAAPGDDDAQGLDPTSVFIRGLPKARSRQSASRAWGGDWLDHHTDTAGNHCIIEAFLGVGCTGASAGVVAPCICGSGQLWGSSSWIDRAEQPARSPKGGRPESASQVSLDEHRCRWHQLMRKFSATALKSAGCTDFHQNRSAGRPIPAKVRATS